MSLMRHKLADIYLSGFLTRNSGLSMLSFVSQERRVDFFFIFMMNIPSDMSVFFLPADQKVNFDLEKMILKYEPNE